MIIYLLLIYATSTVYALLGDIELTQTTSACGEGNGLNVTCPTGSIIAVSRFYYGFWNRTCNKTTDECCVYKEGDCLQMEQNVTDILEELSGKKQMNINASDALAGESCRSQTKEATSTYNQLDYFCINETMMWAVSENVSTEGDPGGPIYLHNRAYPNPVPDQSNYTCSVEATATTTLTLFGLHIDLKCDQTIDIRNGDSNPLLTLNCASAQSGLEENFSTPYIKLTFTNDVSQSGWKFWLGFTAANTGTRLKLRCPAIPKELFKDCGKLEPPINGHISMSNTTHLSTANYSCLQYYNLTSGDATRTCQANGSWSGTTPVCSPAVDCGPLDAPSDGTVNVSATTYSSVATYACSEYYTILSGNSSRTCLASGYWSGEEPVCSLTVECIQNGHCNKPQYECDAGNHKCIYICNNPSIENGNADVDRPVVSSIVTYTCDEGYSLSGTPTRKCQETTGWSGEQPKCVKNCDRPKAPENGNMSLIGSGSIGTVAIFTCNTGYSMHGSQRLDCRENSTWSNEQPECLLTEESVQTQSDQTGLAVTIPIILILLAALILFILYHKGLCNKCQKHEILVEEGRPTDEETKKDIASQSMSNLISKEKNQAKDISTESDAVDKKCPIASAEGVDLDHVYDNPEGETPKKDDKDQANANKEPEQESNKKQEDNASTYENVSDTKRGDAEKPGMSPSEGQNKAEVPVPTDNAATTRSSQVIESSGNPDAKGNDVPIESGGPDTKSAAHIVEVVDGSKSDTVQTGSTEKPLIEFDTEDKKNSKEESTAKAETNAENGVQNTKEGDVKIDKDN